ncbi:MAG: FHA domain-containing protein [Spirulinaceae cyanobacterium RM2_2_10]|nr:FHA domain-containing protein [Spirulinaceae cyanobacterium SM2_1_0]NJO19101.1 FHA domain-containing protein [Spirulinaceae cyanobacterium RM2_2_10]
MALTLLHPSQATPVQSWTFDSESAISIGRSSQNDVVLYSAVVSRRHAEIRSQSEGWELVNFGANGTYVNGQSVKQLWVKDGTILRFGESGPQIRIRIGDIDPNYLGRIVRRSRFPDRDDLAKSQRTLHTVEAGDEATEMD